MFLLIYECRIAVSMRAKWFWKAWHCKLSLLDRLSVLADQKMPQSMMSDRQANSPGGQTFLPHAKKHRNAGIYVCVCVCGKVAGQRCGEVGVLCPSLVGWFLTLLDVDGW